MISSLFSMFDPSGSMLNFWGVGKWVVIFLPVLMLNWSCFPVYGHNYGMLSSLINMLMGIYLSMMKLYGLWCVVFGVVVFFSIACWTSAGLIPYTFTLTSQLSSNFSVGLALCASGVLNYLIVGKTKMLSHLLPLGAPMILAPFLVLVESVSMMIRPLTLSLRLTANVVAGHLLVTLLSEMCGYIFISKGLIYSIVPVIFGAGLLGFEMAVVGIQSYVFYILFSMYWAEAE